MLEKLWKWSTHLVLGHFFHKPVHIDLKWRLLLPHQLPHIVLCYWFKLWATAMSVFSFFIADSFSTGWYLMMILSKFGRWYARPNFPIGWKLLSLCISLAAQIQQFWFFSILFFSISRQTLFEANGPIQSAGTQHGALNCHIYQVNCPKFRWNSANCLVFQLCIWAARFQRRRCCNAKLTSTCQDGDALSCPLNFQKAG